MLEDKTPRTQDNDDLIRCPYEQRIVRSRGVGNCFSSSQGKNNIIQTI